MWTAPTFMPSAPGGPGSPMSPFSPWGQTTQSHLQLHSDSTPAQWQGKAHGAWTEPSAIFYFSSYHSRSRCYDDPHVHIKFSCVPLSCGERECEVSTIAFELTAVLFIGYDSAVNYGLQVFFSHVLYFIITLVTMLLWVHIVVRVHQKTR